MEQSPRQKLPGKVNPFLQITAAAFSALPSPVVVTTAKLLTWLVFDVLRLRRQLIIANLEHCYPANSAIETKKSRRLLQQIGRQSVYQFCLTFFEFMRARKQPLAAQVKVSGGEHLQQALQQGKGVYILCCHLGNWEALAAALSAIQPTHILVKKVGSDSINQFVNDVRYSNGVHPIIRDQKGDGVRSILRALKANHAVGFVMDQWRPGEPMVPFFGEPARTNTGLAALWRRFPAPILPAYIYRTAFARHQAIILPPLQWESDTDKDKDIFEHTLQFNRKLEEMIMQKPEQYFWLHDRWKSLRSRAKTPADRSPAK